MWDLEAWNVLHFWEKKLVYLQETPFNCLAGFVVEVFPKSKGKKSFSRVEQLAT